MPKYIDFLSSQAEIYEIKFRQNTELRDKGTENHRLNGKGGYLIAFHQPDDIASLAERNTKEIVGNTPALIYPTRILHTTISDYKFEKGFSADDRTTNILLEILEQSIPLLKKPRISYNQWLVNRSSLIAAGVADNSFLDTALTIQKKAIERGIELRLPWGTHIISARFLIDGYSTGTPDMISRSKSLKGLGISEPNAIDLATLYFRENGVEYNLLNRFVI